MPKIAMIGAGSMIFCKTLAMDMLATDALKGSEICLMSRTKPKLARMEAFLKEVIRENGLRRSGRRRTGGVSLARFERLLWGIGGRTLNRLRRRQRRHRP